jgi:sugar/nucleoside kinase (ribokinase family)
VYAAGFLYGMVRGLPVETAGYIASVLAGEIIGQHGAQFSQEKANELRERLETEFPW